MCLQSKTEKVELRGARLSPVAVSRLSEALATSVSLATLDVSRSNLGPAGSEQLAAALPCVFGHVPGYHVIRLLIGQ